MKITNKIFNLTVLAVLGSLVLSACGAGKPKQTPTSTLNVRAIQTAAVGIFAAGLTKTAIAMPTATPTLTPPPTKTPTPGGVIRCYSMTYIIDVSIPDNTPMVPGQTFTKTWKVKNSGSCAWEAGFKLVSTAGDAMGGAALVLSTAVSPGADTELSIPMTAPNKGGNLQGTWRMSTASGTFFGDELYILISLSGATTAAAATATSTPTNTPTPTNTLTATPTPTNTP